jgi:hypothetical protein
MPPFKPEEFLNILGPTGQPKDGPELPEAFNPFQPKLSLDHTLIAYQEVVPSATMMAFGRILGWPGFVPRSSPITGTPHISP